MREREEKQEMRERGKYFYTDTCKIAISYVMNCIIIMCIYRIIVHLPTALS